MVNLPPGVNGVSDNTLLPLLGRFGVKGGRVKGGANRTGGADWGGFIIPLSFVMALRCCSNSPFSLISNAGGGGLKARGAGGGLRTGDFAMEVEGDIAWAIDPESTPGLDGVGGGVRLSGCTPSLWGPERAICDPSLIGDGDLRVSSSALFNSATLVSFVSSAESPSTILPWACSVGEGIWITLVELCMSVWVGDGVIGYGAESMLGEVFVVSGSSGVDVSSDLTEPSDCCR